MDSGTNQPGFFFLRGDSMRPLFRPGDRVCFVPCRVDDLQRGDVIIFAPPGKAERIVHRVVSTGPGGVRTRGDANPYVDAWTLCQEDIVGCAASMERNGKVRLIAGGFAGNVLSACIRALRRLDHLASHILHPCYRKLARSGLVRACLPSFLQPRVIIFERGGAREMQLVIGRRIIGRCAPGESKWEILRPFRLIVWEESLPVQTRQTARDSGP
jgi:signal peptidase I